ncbi:unnamed protein product [Prorocentrum cordatum]|uniref:Uncharacterized protein n=1 Tax=Prorocentrum cordatum TaxID=2364126 RepID=A0ABN9SEH7_9DINO|nr:unnamed protein product [Polarella glacialis]
MSWAEKRPVTRRTLRSIPSEFPSDARSVPTSSGVACFVSFVAISTAMTCSVRIVFIRSFDGQFEVFSSDLAGYFLSLLRSLAFVPQVSLRGVRHPYLKLWACVEVGGALHEDFGQSFGLLD